MKGKILKYLSISLVSILSSVIIMSCSSKPVSIEDINELSISTPNNKMGFQFIKEVNKTENNKNVVLSPLSLSTIFSLLQNGAEGNTKEQMVSFLQLNGLSDDKVNLDYSELEKYINSIQKKKGVIKMANSIWIRENFKIDSNFIKIAKDYYDAYTKDVDFSNKNTPEKINSWVDKNTNGKINKIIEVITPNTVAILINALYFDSAWKTEFKPENSYKGNFTMSNGNNLEVNYMNMTEEFQYGKFNDFKMIKLPYKMDGFSMNIILPNENTNIDSFLSDFSYDMWNDSISKLESKNVILTIPKFKVEYEKTLNDVLKGIGVIDAFEPGVADFSSMAQGVYISDVLQKTYIEVDEKGTKAAAVTKVEMKESAMIIDQIEKFDVNRPFIFTLYDEASDMILFIGKIENPNK